MALGMVSAYLGKKPVVVKGRGLTALFHCRLAPFPPCFSFRVFGLAKVGLVSVRTFKCFLHVRVSFQFSSHVLKTRQ